MSASAKDLPDADLENLIREKHRQALAEPGARPQARATLNGPGDRHGGGFRDDPPMTAPALSAAGRLGSGPTLAIDPSDRVLPVTGSGRRRGSLVPIVVVVVAIAAIAAVVTWTQQGSGNFAIFSSPTETPSNSTTDFSVAAENKPPVGQNAPAAAAVSTAAPVQAAAPVQPAAPAPAPAAAAPAPAAVAAPAPAVQQVEKKDAVPVEPKAAEKTAEKKAAEKKTVKPAEKPKQAAEKKVKPAEKPKQAAAKPKPATDDGDASFSTLLNSLTNEAPQQETAAPTNVQPAVQQPAAAPKSTAPLPTSTAPSTPGTQLFNP